MRPMTSFAVEEEAEVQSGDHGARNGMRGYLGNVGITSSLCGTLDQSRLTKRKIPSDSTRMSGIKRACMGGGEKDRSYPNGDLFQNRTILLNGTTAALSSFDLSIGCEKVDPQLLLNRLGRDMVGVATCLFMALFWTVSLDSEPSSEEESLESLLERYFSVSGTRDITK